MTLGKPLFFVVLLLAHAQAVLIPAWIACYIKTRNSKFYLIFPNGNISLLRFGFVCFSIASLAETIDHTNTKWIYINQLSIWNGLFYASLSTGLACLTSATTKRKAIRILVSLLVIAGIVSYRIFGKELTISFQFILTIIFLAQWWNKYQDQLLWLYPLFGICLTTTFGVILSVSGDQIWHVFIGPAGSLSVIILWMTLKRFEKNNQSDHN